MIIKKQIYCTALAVLMLICLILSSCTQRAEKNKYSAYSMDYFDTVITIVGYENTKEEFDAVADDILSQFAMYHKMYSIYHRFEGMENLCTINELSDGKHRTVKVDRPIIDMLLYAKEMYTRTNGTVNIAMGSVLSLWHDYREIGMDNPAEASLPPMEKLPPASDMDSYIT